MRLPNCRPLFLITLGLLHACACLDANGFRTFKDQQGRQMEAKLTRVSGEDVYIERRDGLSTKVSISLFGSEDQAYIRDWSLKKKLADDGLNVRFTEEESDEKEVNEGGITKESYEAHYEIVLKNELYQDIQNLRIEYLMLKFEDGVGAKKRNEGEIKRIKNRIEHPRLKAGDEVRLPTKAFPMLNTQLDPNYYWKGGGKKSSEDELRGIWVKIYVDDQLVHESSKPENLQRTEVW